jgi:predicted peptidase
MKKMLGLVMMVALAGCITRQPDHYSLDKLVGLTESSVSIVGTSDTLDYRIYAPKLTDGEVYPICIFLHNSSEINTNNIDQMRVGFGDIVKYTIESDTPAIIIAPNCPEGKSWTDNDVVDVLDGFIGNLLNNKYTDKERIYLTGFGMGGEGVWSYILSAPDRVSTVAPVCGGTLATKTTPTPDIPLELSDVNIWAIHYLDDRVRTSDLSKKILSGVWTQSTGLSKLTEFPGGGHSANIYSDPDFMGWLFSTKRSH